MLKNLMVLVSTFLVCAVHAEPEIEVVSQFPTAANFVMGAPTVDCRYDFDYATQQKGVEGTYGLFKKAGSQRISVFTCQVRVDNTKQLSEIAFWGNQTLPNVMNYARCDLHVYTNSGAGIYQYDMTPVYSTSHSSIVQYKVTDFTSIPSNQNITSVGFMCDATDTITMISVLGIGVKYN